MRAKPRLRPHRSILTAIEPATRRPPPNCSRWSTTSCASWPPPGWPRRSRARRSRRPPWSTRRTCGWSAATQPQDWNGRGPLLRRRRRGHAPHPRRARPPQAEPSSAAAGRRRVDLDRRRRRPPEARPTTSWPWTRRSTSSAERRPADGPTGQAPLLRRADRRAGRRRPSGIATSTADADWAYARAWLRLAIAGSPADGPEENTRIRPGDRPPLFALCTGRVVLDRQGRRHDQPEARRTRRSSWPPAGAARRRGPAGLPGRGLRRRRGAARPGRGPAPGRRAGAAASWPPPPSTRPRPTDQPADDGPGTVIGPYKLLEQIGEGGSGVVFMAEQTAAGPPQGGPEGHQAGHGHAAGDRPVRGRAAGPGADGPPEHRQGARRRRHRDAAGRTSSWSWSRASRSPSTATSNRLTPRQRLELFVAGLPGGAARPPEGDHPPRPQAVQRPGRAARRRRRCRR